ncbi:MAG: addiction module protein [Planctomycetia bacterium]
MRPNAIEIEKQAMLLTPEEKVQIAERLLTSLTNDPAMESAWADEIDRRIAELEAGTAVTMTVEEAIARARRAIQ